MRRTAISLVPCDGAVFNGKWNLIGAFTFLYAA